MLGGQRLARLVEAVDHAFPLTADAEITLEANPADDLRDTLYLAAKSGVNRLSLGVQSANESELQVLGRRHTNDDVLRTVEDARAAGLENLSLDLMLGIPHQTPESLDRSLSFFYDLKPAHLSTYLLKIEPNTPFFRLKDNLDLPDEDTACDLYLQTVSSLKERGFLQYEISNFAKPGFEAKHNLGYWKLDEYLGLGPAAHSFMEGKRFHFERDTAGFIGGNEPIFDGIGGTAEEYFMLSLRLAEGLDETALFGRYGLAKTDSYEQLKAKLRTAGYLTPTPVGFCLTPNGFLVQNSILTALWDTLPVA